MDNESKFVCGLCGLLVAGVFSILSLNGCLGVRGQKDIYSSEYLGQPSAVVKKDVRWGPDKYFVRLRGNDTLKFGEIITDDRKRITLDYHDCFQKYSIVDSEAEE